MRSLDAINAVDNDGKSVLHLSAQRGNAALITHILSTDTAPFINARDRRGMTPMHYAVESRRAAETIETLARHGAAIDTLDDEGRSPLHVAMERGNSPAVQALLMRSSKVQVKDGDGTDAGEQASLAVRQAHLEDMTQVKNDVALLHQRPELRGKCLCCHRYRGTFSGCTCDRGNGPQGGSTKGSPLRSCFAMADVKVLWKMGLAMVFLNVLVLLWVLR